MGPSLVSIVTNEAGGVSAAPWWALQVRSNHEYRVARELDLRGLAPYVPTFRESVRWSDRTKQVDRILFPGYILAAGDVRRALAVAGVVSVLPSCSEPVEVDPEEIATIRRLTSDMQLKLTPTTFTPGETIRFESGPLAGVSGVVVRVRDGLRLVVNVSMFGGRGVAVELDAESVDLWRTRKQ